MKYTEPNNGWWDIRRSAEHLGVSIAFLREAVRNHQVPYARIGSKNLRFRRDDLDRWAMGSNGTNDAECGERAG